MRLLLQRVSEARVTVDGKTIAGIGRGLLILVGVGRGDGKEQARDLAEKTVHLRIFDDEDGKTNLSVRDVNGEALVVSQFTLYADTSRGRRPGFTDAALPDAAAPLVDLFASLLESHGVPTQTGRFGAHMQVGLVNDGPMTILLER